MAKTREALHAVERKIKKKTLDSLISPLAVYSASIPMRVFTV